MKNKGFTLVELIVTVAILLALTSIVIVTVTGVLKKTNKDLDMAQDKLIRSAVISYYNETGNEDITIGDLVDNKYLDNKYLDKYNRNTKIDISDYIDNDNSNIKLLRNVILDNNEIQNYTPNFNKSAVSQEYYDTVPDTPAYSGAIKKSDLVVENGLFKDIDDDGETYYFRGNVENNYVKFPGLKSKTKSDYYMIFNKWDHIDSSSYPTYDEAKEACLTGTKYGDELYKYHVYDTKEECIDNIVKVGFTKDEDILFRIVRINGDKTIRLIADTEISGSTSFDASKTFLENWYNEYLPRYAPYLANSSFCVDTSTDEDDIEGDITYGGYDRMTGDYKPTFKCPSTTEDFGGKYNAKIGLLTLDELVFAGGSKPNKDYYLYAGTDYILSTPLFFRRENNYVAYASRGGDFGEAYPHEGWSAIPVINLKSNILYVEGNGTKNSPYIIGNN